MNIVIDEFNSNTGFVAFGNASILTENELPEFIAGADNTKSTLFQFTESGDYIEKTGLSIDVSNYQYAVCHFYSTFNRVTSGRYTIAFNDTHEFDLTLFNTLTDISFQLAEITTITKIKITYKGTVLDRLFCSHCLAVSDELPLDIFRATKSLVEKELTRLIGKGFVLGTLNANTGESKLSLNQIAYTALDYIDRYATVLVDDGVNSETHMLEDNDEKFYSLSKLYDGQTMKNDYTNANIYLTIPVRYGLKQQEYNTPSIAITGYNPNAILRGGKVENVYSTFEDGTAYARPDDQIQEHYIQITCIDRAESDIMTFMSQVIRNLIAREVLWINGQRYDIFFEGRPEFIELSDSDRPITGLIYTFKLEVKEEIWINQKLPKTISQNLTVGINQP